MNTVILADGVAAYSTPVFDAPATGLTSSLFEAWGATLAYSLQIYLDFSGYADIAVRLARMFGVAAGARKPAGPRRRCGI